MKEFPNLWHKDPHAPLSKETVTFEHLTDQMILIVEWLKRFESSAMSRDGMVTNQKITELQDRLGLLKARVNDVRYWLNNGKDDTTKP